MKQENSAVFKIPGAPIAWQRARISKHGGFYDPQKHLKNAINIHLSNYEGPLLEGPLFLNVTFFVPIPKSFSKKKIGELVGSFHSIKADLDNNLKFFLDTLQSAGTIFKDDACIAGILAFKIWELHDKARTEFEFVSLDKLKYKPGINPAIFLDQFSVSLSAQHQE